MIPQEFITIAIALLTGIFSLIGWLLKDKDAKQQAVLDVHKESIDLLFGKFDSVSGGLQDMRVQLASEHYRKSELDAKLDRLDNSIRDGLHAISTKVDKLTDAIMASKK